MFVKTGDPKPIENIIDATGEILVCPKCKKPLNEIEIDNGELKAICTCEGNDE